MYNNKAPKQDTQSHSENVSCWVKYFPATHIGSVSTEVKTGDAKQNATSFGALGKFIPTCHFCHRRGHNRPKCYLLQSYLAKLVENNRTALVQTSHREWKPKPSLKFLVAHTLLAGFQTYQWYFDSGCSKHMTGNISLLINYSKGADGVVTFGDGNKGEIYGKCDLLIADLPPVKNVLFVKGLKANLLSIS